MVTDHGAAGKRLEAIAQRKGLQLPTKLDTKSQAALNKFSHLHGKAFDQQYVPSMVAGHRDALARIFHTKTKK